MSRKYTLITGASLGFGRCLALECARRKMDLILIDLPGTGCRQLASVIRKEYEVSVVVIEKDLLLEESCLQVAEEIEQRGLEVNILINNAGVGSTDFFVEGDIHQYQKQIRLNVLATTTLTYFMLENLKRNAPAHILNVGSLASYFDPPKKQVYGATKSFIYSFSCSLRKELLPEKIYVSVVCPGGMFTNLRAIETIQMGDYLTRASSMKPQVVAPIAIDGLLKKKAVIIPGKLNRLFVFLDQFVPNLIRDKLVDKTMKRLKTTTETKVIELTRETKEDNEFNFYYPDKSDVC